MAHSRPFEHSVLSDGGSTVYAVHRADYVGFFSEQDLTEKLQQSRNFTKKH
jgi:hypothetical protein